MSPDKAHTVTLAAAILVTTGLGPRSAVEEAANLYDLAVEQVRASGPTSTDPCSCTSNDLGPDHCPIHG